MDTNLIALIVVGGIGLFFLLLIFVLPLRKTPEEKTREALYEERCSINWRYKGGIIAGGNIPIARISFYDEFFVVALINATKVPYTDVLSCSSKSGWLSSSIEVTITGGRRLLIYSKNVKNVARLIKEKAGRQ